MVLTSGVERRLLRMLERAGTQGLTARDVVPLYWPRIEKEKERRAPCVAGRMLCALVDRGYASRYGNRRANAVYCLQAPGREKLAQIEAEEAEQARQNAARGGRAPKFPGDDASEEQGPWF